MSNGKMVTSGSGILIVLAAASAPVLALEKSAADSKLLQWRNDSLTVSWRSGDLAVRLQRNKDGESIAIPIGISALEFDVGRLSRFKPDASEPIVTQSKLGANWRFVFREAAVPDSDIKVRCLVEFTFDSSSPWITKKARLEIKGAPPGPLLKKVVLDKVDFSGQHPRQP